MCIRDSCAMVQKNKKIEPTGPELNDAITEQVSHCRTKWRRFASSRGITLHLLVIAGNSVVVVNVDFHIL